MARLIALLLAALLAPVALVDPAGADENLPPTALAQALSTPADTPLTILLAGVDPEGEPLRFEWVDGPGRGTLTPIALNGAVLYSPSRGFSGTDLFRFRVSDGTTWSAPQAVSITVGAVPPPLPGLEVLCGIIAQYFPQLLPWFRVFGVC